MRLGMLQTLPLLPGVCVCVCVLEMAREGEGGRKQGGGWGGGGREKRESKKWLDTLAVPEYQTLPVLAVHALTLTGSRV